MAQAMDELIPTRATLIQRLKNWQDQSSWQDFFDTYWKLIYDIARKRGLTDTEAEDVVQETMISVAKHIPTFRYDPTIGSFKAWLFNMTRWRITDQLRKRRRLVASLLPPSAGSSSDETSTGDPAAGAGLEEADPATHDWEALWDAEWEENLLNAAIAKVKRRIDPQKYQIFDLYMNKEWAPDKVAATFGVSVDQVYLVKHRVTEMIKGEVKRLEREMT